MSTQNIKNILTGKEKIFKTEDTRNNAGNVNKKEYINLGRFSKYQTPEQRLRR